MKTGKLVAACTKATIVGLGASEVINHAAPTFCIQVPMLEATDAIQRARNNGCRSGLQAELGAGLDIILHSRCENFCQSFQEAQTAPRIPFC
jgi:hypothetical protein